MTDLKAPPKSVIRAGYAMKRWREAECDNEYAQEYRDDAIRYVRKATKELNALTRDNPDKKRVFYYDGANVLAMLYRAAAALSNPQISYFERMAAANLIGSAHQAAAAVCLKAGFRLPTDEEMTRLGGGGGR